MVIHMSIWYIFKKNKKKDKQLSLSDKWKIDSEFYDNNPNSVKTGESQCYRCVYFNKNNPLFCSKVGEISKDIIFGDKDCKFREEKEF